MRGLDADVVNRGEAAAQASARHECHDRSDGTGDPSNRGSAGRRHRARAAGLVALPPFLNVDAAVDGLNLDTVVAAADLARAEDVFPRGAFGGRPLVGRALLDGEVALDAVRPVGVRVSQLEVEVH